MTYAERLLEWFDENKREMPWRNTSNPYYIWISEVMLQQTQVETVKPYYERFVERFPTIEALAEASLEEVYQYWQGLGYYRRAENLHKGAKVVADKYQGVFPQDPKLVKDIPGIGPYTLGAVLSIAFHIPLPAVDGNVMRILSRQFLIEEDIAVAKNRRVFEHKVMELMPDDPNRFNQALMELGALVCTPKSPKCEGCPIRPICKAYSIGRVMELPIKTKKTKSVTMQYKVLLLERDGKYLMEKRPAEGLLANLWGFPMMEADEWVGEYAHQVTTLELEQVRHVFTHRKWEMQPIIIRTVTEQELMPLDDKQERKFVTLKEMKELPIGTAFTKIISQLEEVEIMGYNLSLY